MNDSERIARLEEIVAYQSKVLDAIAADVKSLLQTRSFARGAVWIAGGVSAIVSLFIGWLKAAK